MSPASLVQQMSLRRNSRVLTPGSPGEPRAQHNNTAFDTSYTVTSPTFKSRQCSSSRDSLYNSSLQRGPDVPNLAGYLGCVPQASASRHQARVPRGHYAGYSSRASQAGPLGHEAPVPQYSGPGYAAASATALAVGAVGASIGYMYGHRTKLPVYEQLNMEDIMGNETLEQQRYVQLAPKVPGEAYTGNRPPRVRGNCASAVSFREEDVNVTEDRGTNEETQGETTNYDWYAVSEGE
ncbi:hypothetical protein EJ05DRAFT_509952 [Pseudovirgaria hyperparasitica]|uniref:Uncharacterized protein n=1 Tax=Pseudovirgaria hyperparasitica TaxID=470096 RepID=A0A6A6WB70_9PEZI|nr:uncharacterized protein EJ05DRAFT_509952 [Pseudovirgaria hyperparasitica]KAF2759086.1 hypothetical protein EJ05DRAFT_509952 [Pseudovirgaria hyperparasitica]